MDLRPNIEAALDAFALEAIVTVPDMPEVETRVFWLPSQTVEVPAGTEVTRAEERRVLVLSKVDVPQVPRGTIIQIAEYEGGQESLWRVDSMEKPDFDHHRVVVVPHVET